MGTQALFSHFNGKKHNGNFYPKRAKANPSKAVETDTACAFV